MTNEVKAEGKFVEVTWKRAFKVWWSLAWRGLLFGFLGGGVVGFILGFILGIARVNPNTIRLVGQIAGGIVGIPIGVAILRIVLRKRYSDFRIALIEE